MQNSTRQQRKTSKLKSDIVISAARKSKSIKLICVRKTVKKRNNQHQPLSPNIGARSAEPNMLMYDVNSIMLTIDNIPFSFD